VPLLLRDTLRAVKLLRVLVDVLWQKAVLVLMTNENILSQPAQDQNNHNHRGKDIKLSPSSAILYPLHLYNFITSHINYLILFKYNYNLARSS